MKYFKSFIAFALLLSLALPAFALRIDNPRMRVKVAAGNNYTGTITVDNPTQDQIDNDEVLTFGHFALNWPWNFQRLSATPYSEWTVVKNTYQKWDYDSDAYINAVTYSEPVLNRIVVDGALHSKSKFPGGGWEYKIHLPIEISDGLQSSDVFELMYYSAAGGNAYAMPG